MRHEAVSPVVGCLADLSVDDGEMVREGELVCCLESMKVMFQIYAPASGRLEYKVELGEIVGEGEVVLVVISEDG